MADDGGDDGAQYAAPIQGKHYKIRKHGHEEWTDEKYEARYRIDKAGTRYLSNWFAATVFCSTLAIRSRTSLDAFERVCLALRYFATGACFQLIGEAAGVHYSTVQRCVYEFTMFLVFFARFFIKMPVTEQALHRKATRFYQLHGQKGGVIARMDGTHFALKGPSENGYVYVNRKGYHSINAMIVADADHMILSVDATIPGSQNDQFVYDQSQLKLVSELGFLRDYVIIGDSGYTCRDNVIVPFLNPNTDRKRAYNDWFVETRQPVENTIGILKARWRCLDTTGGPLQHTPEYASDIITACCCLHNFARQRRVPIRNDPQWHPAYPIQAQPLQDQNNQDGQDDHRRTRFMQRYWGNLGNIPPAPGAGAQAQPAQAAPASP